MTATATPAHAALLAQPTSLASRIYSMARAVHGKPSHRWPAWSTGERVMVALVLNDAKALHTMGYTILEAIDRADLTPAQLLRIAREVS